jgi:hypothetical protein
VRTENGDRCACGSEVIPRRVDFLWRVENGEHWRHACGPAGTITPPKPKQVRGSERSSRRSPRGKRT